MTENARGGCQKEGLLVCTRASSTNVSKPENQKTKKKKQRTKKKNNKKKQKTSENYVRYYHLLVQIFFGFLGWED